MKKIPNWIKYLLLFFLFLSIYCFLSFPNIYGDPINNYMFSHAIAMGEVPYLDFNTVSTPLYAFLMSFGLLFFDNYLMFTIEQSLLVTVLFYFLFEIYGKKSFFVLLVIALFAFFAINATYNFLAFFLLVFLIYLEKKYPNKDYLIGFVIGCAILSKQTVGVLFVLPSIIYYFRDRKKLGKRIVGLIIPCVIFFLYLILNHAVVPFFDLCFFGLFDFSSKNGQLLSIYFIISLVLFFLQLFLIRKSDKDITNYYLLMGISFVIPIFDFHHFSIYILCVVMQLLPLLKFHEDYFSILAFILFIVVSLFIFINYLVLLKPVFSTHIPRFQYTLQSSYDYYTSVDNYQFFDQYDSKLLLSYGSVQYNISRGNPITYFDILMYGNYGYRGSDKMIEKVKKMKDTYIIVDMEEYYNDSLYNQFDKIIVKYVVDHYEEVDSWRSFKVYYKN